MTKGYLFRGEPVSFEEAFPDIAEIKIEGTEGDIAQKRNILLNKNNLGISCSNSLCEDGGYNPELGDFISEMYRNKEISKESIISCKGHENMGRRQTRRCLNYMSIKVEIKYKRCPKCKIDLINEDYKSIKQRNLGVLLAEKRQKDDAGTYEEFNKDKDCDLCGASLKEIMIDNL